MCRLYGFRSTERTKVECTLVRAQNAILSQSRSDERGLAHADGWGIAAWADGRLEVERHERAAYEDLHFAVTAERVAATGVIAHVRHATVGETSQRNTHPFRHGCWAMAHNGTVTGFATLAGELEKETAPGLRGCRLGTTDSEAVFYWLLTRLAQAGADLDRGAPDEERVRGVVRDAVSELDARCRSADPEGVPRLNLLISDGRILVASRWNHSLHYVARDGIRDCEVCGIPHIDHAPGHRYRAVVIASEPISHEPWLPVPEGHVISVGNDVAARLEPIPVPTR